MEHPVERKEEAQQQNLYLGLKAPLFQLFFELENDTATSTTLSF